MWTDGHCHPTDSPESIDKIESLDCRMACMSTRFDDLDLVADAARRFPKKVVPAFGLHPWYSHLLALTTVSKLDHYSAVLEPAPGPEDPIFDHLPEPVLLSDHISRIERLLVEFPSAILGEVGLDKAFRIKLGSSLSKFRVKLDHQRTVLQAQLELASQLGRSVSLHGVQTHQYLLDSLRPYQAGIASICLHSYGGSAEFYAHHWKKLSVPVYVSIAVLINGKVGPDKLKLLLSGLDPQYVLSESDYYAAGQEQVDLVQASARIFGHYFKWTDEEAALQLEHNFNCFVAVKASDEIANRDAI